MSMPPRSPDSLMQRGFAAQQQGRLADAEALLRQALTISPAHAGALQLLGSVLRKRGDPIEAERLMRRSLELQPLQANVHNNLGNLLLALERPHEARASFEQAVSQEPGYADAHFNHARALHRLGLWEEATVAVRQALAAYGRPNAAALQLLARIEEAQGRLDQALATLDLAQAADPARAAVHHNRATLLQRRHRHAEALSAHERALALGLDVADAHYNHGNTLQSLGQHAEAETAYRRALAREPLHQLAWYDLARLRWRQGDEHFDAELRVAAAQPGAPAALGGMLGQLLWRAERFAAAEEAFAQACAREPMQARWHDGLGRCRVRQGQLATGLAAHARAVALLPGDCELRSNHASSLLLARRPDAALAETDAALQLNPLDQQVWALQGLAWRLMGDQREGWLNDYARFVGQVQLDPPPGFATIEAFMQALAEELRALHRDRHAPVDQTLRHGTQTLGDIFEQGHPLVTALRSCIAQAVAAWVQRLPRDPDHPFAGRPRKSWRFADSWSSRLTSGGFHVPHVHPHGWLSSACYVHVPAEVAAPGSRQGWLRFGKPDLDVGLTEPAQFEVQPRPGLLVLFPSLFWHGTTAFESAAERLTVAFDVVPAL